MPTCNGSRVPRAKENLRQACDKARELFRAGDPGSDTGHIATVGEAVDDYERDLKARDGHIRNATWLRFQLIPVTMGKPVALLTAKEVRAIRDGLIDKGLARASANRFMKAFAACLNLAAKFDPHIKKNRDAWKLEALPDATVARNMILTEAQVRDVTACYDTGGDRFGIYMEAPSSIASCLRRTICASIWKGSRLA